MSHAQETRMRVVVGVVSMLCLWASAFARVQYPVAAAYEDTVRIMVLYNAGAFGPPTGCGSNPTVGSDTRNFVIAALDTTRVRNVRVSAAVPATANSVSSAFGGKKPHVIVHANAGWTGASGNNIPSIITWALSNNVGFVEIGDDDMLPLSPLFPWTYVIDMWGPMVTGVWLNKAGDRLYVVMAADLDTWSDSSAYPNLNGVIRNARRIAGSDTIGFKPTGTGSGARCEADPDVIGLLAGRQNNALFLAYQQGYNAVYDSATPGLQGSGDQGPAGYVGNAWDYCVVTILQDSMQLVGGGWVQRRAVSFSIQPQFLSNQAAAQQFIYDGIMYASLVHQVNPPPPYTNIGHNPIPRKDRDRLRINSGAVVRIADIGGRTVFQGRADAHGRIALSTIGLQRGVYVMTTVSSGSVRSMTFAVHR